MQFNSNKLLLKHSRLPNPNGYGTLSFPHLSLHPGIEIGGGSGGGGGDAAAASSRKSNSAHHCCCCCWRITTFIVIILIYPAFILIVFVQGYMVFIIRVDCVI